MKTLSVADMTYLPRKKFVTQLIELETLVVNGYDLHSDLLELTLHSISAVNIYNNIVAMRSWIRAQSLQKLVIHNEFYAR